MDCQITIVIPVYNVASYLGDCLASLPESDCKIILVNDGSTDKSGLICHEFAAKRSHVTVFDTIHQGLSEARNHGLYYVDTPYTFFLDADDILCSAPFLKAVDYAVANSLDWTQCGYAIAYKDHSIVMKIGDSPELLSKDYVFSTLIKDGYIKNFACFKIYKTEIIKKFSFPVGKYYEDVFWQYKVIDASRTFAIFPKTTAFYRQRNDSISGSISLRLTSLIEALEERILFFRKHYPSYINLSAYSIWDLSKTYSKKCNSKDKRIFREIEHRIRNSYQTEIKAYLSSLKGMERLTGVSNFKGYPIYRTLKFTQRALNRISRGKSYIKVPLNHKTKCSH